MKTCLDDVEGRKILPPPGLELRTRPSIPLASHHFITLSPLSLSSGYMLKTLSMRVNKLNAVFVIVVEIVRKRICLRFVFLTLRLEVSRLNLS
jgi:hypothetical protein